MWVSKWQHFHFCLNYSFNIIWQECNPTALICFYPILFQFKMTSVRIVTSYLESVDSMRKLHPENTTNIFTADVNKIWLTLWFTKGACGFFFVIVHENVASDFTVFRKDSTKNIQELLSECYTDQVKLLVKLWHIDCPVIQLKWRWFLMDFDECIES